MNTFKDIAIQSSLLVVTFTVVEIMYQNDMESSQLTTVAFTGIAITLVSHYVIRKIKINSPKKYRKKRIKKFSRL